MITVIGLGNDPTIRHFIDHAHHAGIAVRLVDLHELASGDWLFPLPGQDASWRHGGPVATVPKDDPCYVRIIDLSPATTSQRETLAWQGMLCGITAWLETIPARVINRPGHALDNGSKPLHEALLARLGFRVPPSITSSDADILAAFARLPAVVKSISGIRADCWSVTPGDLAGFDPHSGPIHLQRRIEGADIRAHVVDQQVIAAEIVADSVDYRIDSAAEYAPLELPDGLCARMVAAARDMRLEFSGWDFKRDRDGTCWLLEVNPMPGYHAYDRHLDGRITAALTATLLGDAPCS
jgi:hypothetical protein